MNECDIFIAALDKSSLDEREAYLEEVCGGDSELRRRIESLLASHGQTGSLLEHPALGGAITVSADQSEVATDGVADHKAREAAGVEGIQLDFLAPHEDTSALGRLGPYVVTGVVGRGGMGLVLKAQDAKLNRVVAIKLLAPELACNPTAKKRFLREARAAASVVHQHVVTIHAVDEDRLPYLVMEYIDGLSLQEKIDREGHLQLKEILRIGQQVAAGLAAAHAHGLMHRDVKPANILLENGVERVRITDFGLARAVDDVGMTRTGEVAGTPQYMSPEQAQALPMDARSDLFSLGCVLYAMCTGRPPFRAETTLATVRRVCEDTPRPIRDVNPEVPQWLVEIIDRLLAKQAAERFQTAREVADLLSRYLADVQHPSSVGQASCLPSASGKRISNLSSMPQASRKPASQRRLLATAAMVLLCLLAGLGLAEATGTTQLTATVIRIFTPSGTLVVETDDPAVKVTIEGDGGLVITGAGLHEVRLKPGSYKIQADKNGQRVPLERELVSIAKGGREVVRVKLETAPVPAVAKTEKGAFVLLAGLKERKFNTLAEAVLAAASGGTIEVRGDGPFETSPITIRHPLVIRAGNGSRPQIRLRRGETGHVLLSSAPLVLEGLEIHYRLEELTGDLLERDLQQRDGVVRCDGAALAVANCRLIGDGKRSILQSWPSPSARVVNSELLNSAWDAVSWNCNSPARLTIDNSILAASGTGFLTTNQRTDGPEGYSVCISRCTTLMGWGTLGFRRKWALTAPQQPGSPDAPPLAIELVANVLDAPFPVVNLSPFDAFMTAVYDLPREERNLLLPKLFAWHEDYNLYGYGKDFCCWIVRKPGDRESRTAATREEWTALFQLQDTHAQHGQPRFKGGNLRARLAADPQSLTPDDFRLLQGSPGYRAGPGGKDLGADVDLVGPGPAYERWKKTPEYQDWLKDTGQLKDRAAAEPETGAFVVQGGTGVAERKFDTLAEAVQVASDGDTIEIRGNGPFVTIPIAIPERRLTIRAGQGYRPMVSLTADALQGRSPLLYAGGPLVLEGLELQRMAREAPVGWWPPLLHSKGSLRMANCRFRSTNTPFSLWGNSPVLELRNCEFLHSGGYGPGGRVALVCGELRSGQRLIVDNCVVTEAFAIHHKLVEEREAVVQLTRNTFRSPKWLVELVLDEAPTLSDASPDAKLLRIEATGNVLVGNMLFRLTQNQNPPPILRSPAAEHFLANQLVWKGERNLYAIDEAFLNVFVNKEGYQKTEKATTTLSSWREFWGAAERDSLEDRVRFQGGEVLEKLAAVPDQITAEDFRLREDSAGYRASKDGKDLGADIDVVGPGAAYERWKKTPEYEQWLKETGQFRAEAPKAEAGAFVRLGGKGVAERKFDTLADAVQSASSGDTIEIRGNGPFDTPPIRITGNALTIRAGQACGPVIRLNQEGLNDGASIFVTDAPLVLEGLELQLTGRPTQDWPERPPVAIDSRGGAPFHMANCTLLNKLNYPNTGLLLLHKSQHCGLRNCLFLAAQGSLLNWPLPADKGEFVMDNCASGGNVSINLYHVLHNPHGILLQLTRNTTVTNELLFNFALDRPLPTPSIRVVASENVFETGPLFQLNQNAGFYQPSQPLAGAEAQALVPRLLDWRGERNLHSVRRGYLTLSVGKGGKELLPPATPIETLKEWNRFFKAEDADSLEGQARYQGGALLARIRTAVEQLTADDFRLRPDSLGYRAGPDGKDLGADVDLVGPGPAYERWKKTTDYQQWLKEAGQKK